MKNPTATAVSLTLLDSQGSIKQLWPLAGKKSYRLGRATTNDIALPYPWVSRQHAMIQVEANGAHNAIDLGSSNGTFVNGKRIYTPTTLRSGDLLRIGQTTLTFINDRERQEPPEAEEKEDQTVAFRQKELVTILVCDIHNYTRLSELLGAQQISNLLGFWTKQVNELVQKHGGNVDKFIGDAVMAIWSNPEGSVAHNIHQALRTALAISLFTKKLGAKIPEIPMELRIGAALNTGEAITGNLGVDGRRDYTVIGDVVNVTFRLEKMTTQSSGLDLLLGPETAKYLRPGNPYFSSCRYAVRGREEEIEAFGCSFAQLQQYLTTTNF
jgi:adenylate cyclase